MNTSTKWDALVSWAQTRGIFIQHVKAQGFPGRGTGMVATTDIEAGTEIINVPFTAIIHPECNIPLNFHMDLCSDKQANHRAPSRKLAVKTELPRGIYGMDRGITTHGLIAAYLTYDTSAAMRYGKWKGTWPSMGEFREGMPFLWPEELGKRRCGVCLRAGVLESLCEHGDEEALALLPPEIGGSWSFSIRTDGRTDSSEGGKIAVMRQKLLKDWAAVKKSRLTQSRIFKPIDGESIDGVDETFLYHWCIVNTRSFYFLLDGEEPPKNSDDAMILCPVIDIFNHTEKNLGMDKPGKESCSVSFSDDGFAVTMREPTKAGEELYVSYGPHSNDFLFAEYGFILHENHHDVLYLDDLVLRDFSEEQRELLEQHGYLGQYALQHSQPPSNIPEVCHRTFVAAHLIVLSRTDWLAYINDPSYLTPPAHPAPLALVNGSIAKWIGIYKDEASRCIEALKGMSTNIIKGLFGDSKGKERERRRTAMARHELVLRRWKEIWEMCWRAEEGLQKAMSGETGETS